MSPERNWRSPRFEEVVAHAKEMVVQGGQHTPTLIVEGTKGLAVGQIREMPETHGERVELMHMFGQVAAKSGKFGRLVRIFFVSEGWMSVATKDKPPEMRPSQDPNRKEVLIISGLALQDQRKDLRIFEMVRNESKRVVNLEEMLPASGREGEVEIPLLDAFAEGFCTAFQAQFN